MKKIFLAFVFIIFGCLFLAKITIATTVNLGSPDASLYNIGENINFTCDVNTEGTTPTDVSLVAKDADGNYLVKNTKKSYFLAGDGISTSTVHLSSATSSVLINPTKIIDSSYQTCGTPLDPCNLFSTSGGWDNVGGYWSAGVVSSLGYTSFTITLDDYYKLSSFYIRQHETNYARNLKLEYSEDNINWATLYNSTINISQTINFPTPVIGKYIRARFTNFNTSVHYVYYIDLMGEHVVPSAYNGQASFDNANYFLSGENYWNCRVNDSGSYTYASSDKTFTSNSTAIEFDENTPADGATEGHTVIGSNVSSTNNYLKFINVNDSLKTYYSFNESTNKNYSSVGNISTTTAFTATTTFGYLGGGISSGKINNLGNLFSDKFTIVFSFYSTDSGASGYYFEPILSISSNNGFKVRMYSPSNGTDTMQLLFYDNGSYTGAKQMTANIIETGWNRIAFTIDRTNNKAKFFLNGQFISEDNSVKAFTPQSFITFSGGSLSYFDEIMILDRFVTNAEGVSLTNTDNNNNLDLDDEDIDGTFQAVVIDSAGAYDETETRDIHSLEQPTLENCYSYDKTNKKHYYICSPEQSTTVPENITVDYQYSFDNTNWTATTTLYKNFTTDTFAVIGDSMSNESGDWPGYFASRVNIPYSSISNYAVAGNTCSQVYNQLVNSVADNTDYLFATCGINAFTSYDNTQYWENIYNTAKLKGIGKIYMTTMPPYNGFNSQSLETATTNCNKMKRENQWLIDFAADKDDLIVSDIWTYLHDTSGTNITDCGFRTDVTLTSDGVHPNSTGSSYWADQHWTNGFDKLKNGTKYIDLNFPRYIEDKTLYVKGIPTYNNVVGTTYEFTPLSITGITTELECDNEGYNWYNGACYYDTTSPTISEVTPAPSSGANRTPSYTFSSTEAGTITYGGSCSSNTTNAVSGNNTITFNELSDGTYSNCTITVMDVVGNVSNTLNITQFSISSGGGFTPPPPPSTGIGSSDSSIGMYQTLGVGSIDNAGKNLLMYIESKASFMISPSNSGGSSQNHSLTITDVDLSNKKVKVLIESNPISLELALGETKYVDIDNDKINDIEVKFQDLLSNRVELTVKALNKDNSNTNTSTITLFKYTNNSKVYLLENNKKRWIVDEYTFNTKGYKWSSVKTIESSIAYPDGDNLQLSKSTTNNKYLFKSFLTISSKGEEVRQLQQKLKDLGYFTYPTITGYYGYSTSNAVKLFQKANNIKQLGYVGPATRGALNK